MIKLRIEEILKERGITKTDFANQMGVRKQNIRQILETNDLRKLEKAASILNLKISDLWEQDNKERINGYVEVDNEIYKITNRADVINLLNKIDSK